MDYLKIGKIVFWIAAAYLLVFGWLLNWWIVPMYKYTIPEEINQSIWRPYSFLFWIWVFAPILGAMLVAIGKTIHVDIKKTWLAVVIALAILLLNLFPSKTGYLLWIFGVIGGLISAFFIALVWYWGKTHSKLKRFSQLIVLPKIN